MILEYEPSYIQGLVKRPKATGGNISKELFISAIQLKFCPIRDRLSEISFVLTIHS